MRTREVIEDFRGGHVACRSCRKLMYFDPEEVAGSVPQKCCEIVYVPTRAQVDLHIYDRLGPDDFPDVQRAGLSAPVVIEPLEDAPSVPEEWEEALSMEEMARMEAELDAVVVSPEDAKARRQERIETLKRRGAAEAAHG